MYKDYYKLEALISYNDSSKFNSSMTCVLYLLQHDIFFNFPSLNFCLEIVGHNIDKGGGAAMFTCTKVY